MDKQRQDDQLEPTYSSSVPIRDVALKTYRKQWTIGRGGERESGISMMIAQYDDDNGITKFELYIDVVLIVYMVCVKILGFFIIVIMMKIAN